MLGLPRARYIADRISQGPALAGATRTGGSPGGAWLYPSAHRAIAGGFG
jgi:hypothetical protein